MHHCCSYVLCPFVNAFLEIFQHTITGAHSKRDDWHGGGLVSTTRENACVNNVENRILVGLRPLVRVRCYRLIPAPADPSLAQASSGPLGLDLRAHQFTAPRTNDWHHHLFLV